MGQWTVHSFKNASIAGLAFSASSLYALFAVMWDMQTSVRLSGGLRSLVEGTSIGVRGWFVGISMGECVGVFVSTDICSVECVGACSWTAKLLFTANRASTNTLDRTNVCTDRDTHTLTHRDAYKPSSNSYAYACTFYKGAQATGQTYTSLHVSHYGKESVQRGCRERKSVGVIAMPQCDDTVSFRQ